MFFLYIYSTLYLTNIYAVFTSTILHTGNILVNRQIPPLLITIEGRVACIRFFNLTSSALLLPNDFLTWTGYFNSLSQFFSFIKRE